MKNKSLFLVVIAIMFISSSVYAAKNETAGSSGGASQPIQVVTQPQQDKSTLSPTVGQVSNQNQVKTQNQGEESQLQISTQEKEDAASQSASNIVKSQIENASLKVEELIKAEPKKGAVNDQIKQIAQDQKSVQSEIKSTIDKVDGRSGLLKSLIGPDYQALKNMQKQMEQNQLRLQQLEQLKNQLANEGESEMIQEAIAALVSQNTALQDRINLEEKASGLFGWLFKMFAK